MTVDTAALLSRRSDPLGERLASGTPWRSGAQPSPPSERRALCGRPWDLPPGAHRVRSGAGANLAVAELAAIRQDWEAAGRPEPKAHVHRTPVRFDDGTTVMGVRFLGDDPYARQDEPAFGLYLDERWEAPWPHEHFDWPDFGVPDDLDALRRVLTDLLDRARNGERVEVGCLGGHGRTGTALACLAVLTVTPANDALAWGANQLLLQGRRDRRTGRTRRHVSPVT